MKSLIAGTIARISSSLKSLPAKQFLPVVLIGFLFLTTNVASGLDSGRSGQSITNKIDKVIHQGDSQRPKTTGEWNREARETEGEPGERAARIAKESAAAVKDFGNVYPDTAKSSTGS